MTEMMTAKRSVAGQVLERVKAQQCLLCDEKGVRRGLCFKHYQMYIRRRDERAEGAERVEFEVAAIREGKILASHAMRRMRGNDPFAQL